MKHYNRKYISPAGRLFTKSEAKTCGHCGIALWKPIYKPSAGDQYVQYDDKGNRLGYEPLHGNDSLGMPVCWNSKACLKRSIKTKPDKPSVSSVFAAAVYDQMLAALKLAYRKDVLLDNGVSWSDLDQSLMNALREAMGDDGYQAWLKEIGNEST